MILLHYKLNCEYKSITENNLKIQCKNDVNCDNIYYKKTSIIPTLPEKGVEKMKGLRKRQKAKKKDDCFFKISICFFLGCILLCFAAVAVGEGSSFRQICAVGAGIFFILGLIFLCLAGAEGQEPYLMEPHETLSREQMDELKEMLKEAQERIRKK